MSDHNDIDQNPLSKIQDSFLQQFRDSFAERRFVFLLVGKTGVGKSSTINSLMGKEVSEVGLFEPVTKTVEFFNAEIQGISYTVIDTPGFREDESTDVEYLAEIQSKVEYIDCLWLVTELLRKSRIEEDEQHTIRIISEKFGAEVWKRTLLIFTFADQLELSEFEERYKQWSQLLQEEIGKHTDPEIARSIPTVAVANGKNRPLPLPSGKAWLGELYTKVFLRISTEAAIPFYLSVEPKVDLSDNTQEIITTRPDVIERTFNKAAISTPAAIKHLNENYEQTRKQATGWYRMSLAASTVGFLLFGSGIITVFIGELQIGIITSLSGIIPNVAAALFFIQSRKANDRVDSISVSLSESQRIQVAVEIANSLVDKSSSDKLKSQIAKSLLQKKEIG